MDFDDEDVEGLEDENQMDQLAKASDEYGNFDENDNEVSINI